MAVEQFVVHAATYNADWALHMEDVLFARNRFREGGDAGLYIFTFLHCLLSGLLSFALTSAAAAPAVYAYAMHA